MPQIDLTQNMPPLWPTFGGNGEILTYSELNCSAGLRPLRWNTPAPAAPSGDARASISNAIYVEWSARGVGFGSAYLSDEEGSVEGMSRPFIAAVLRRFVLDAAWSNDGWRAEREIFPDDLQVRVANTEEQVGLQYSSATTRGTIYFGTMTRNYGEVDMVNIDASDLKSEASVIAIVLTWLATIPQWG